MKVFCIERTVFSVPFFTDEVGYRYEKLVRDTETDKVSTYKLDRKKAQALIAEHGMVLTEWRGTYRRWECPNAPYTCKADNYRTIDSRM